MVETRSPGAQPEIGMSSPGLSVIFDSAEQAASASNAPEIEYSPTPTYPELYITKTNDSYLLALWPFMDLISRTVLIMLEIHGLPAKSCG